MIDWRGNINTRYSRFLEDDKVFAIVLAAAGVKRLKMPVEHMHYLNAVDMPPSPNQGTLCVQLLEERTDLAEVLQQLCTYRSDCCFRAERIVTEILGADCRSAMGVFATSGETEDISISSVVYERGGGKVITSKAGGSINDFKTLAENVAQDLLSQGAKELLH